jgi:hypothetical protein
MQGLTLPLQSQAMAELQQGVLHVRHIDGFLYMPV